MTVSFRERWEKTISLKNWGDVERNWFFYGDYKGLDQELIDQIPIEHTREFLTIR